VAKIKEPAGKAGPPAGGNTMPGPLQLKDAAEIGRRLFAAPCAFIWAAAAPTQLPPPGPPEIAFTGRSNVGKSSLLNALTGRKSLARTSRAPGRTRELNFFALENSKDGIGLRFVDMPGYGFAAAAKTKIAAWTTLAHAYLRGRAPLLRVFVLIDGRHGIKDLDLEMFDLLDDAAVSYQVVLTKRDEVKMADQAARTEAALRLLATRKAAYPAVIFTSASTGEGIEDLRTAIATLVLEQGGMRPKSG
jgi:GTP-binding protein